MSVFQVSENFYLPRLVLDFDLFFYSSNSEHNTAPSTEAAFKEVDTQKITHSLENALETRDVAATAQTLIELISSFYFEDLTEEEKYKKNLQYDFKVREAMGVQFNAKVKQLFDDIAVQRNWRIEFFSGSEGHRLFYHFRDNSLQFFTQELAKMI